MISVVLCGGAGSRLWPVSRELYPKPFLKLPDGESFIQKAFRHGLNAPGSEGLMTITNKEFFFKIEEEFLSLGTEAKGTYVLEPFGRNTAPAVAAATLWAKRLHGENAVMLILASDHYIADGAAFNQAVGKAQEIAEQGKLVVFGMNPTFPATAYGYIETAGNEVVRFVEKPSEGKAKEFVAAGNFLWNAGIFCFQAKTMLEELAVCAPELLDRVEKCVDASARVSETHGSDNLDLDPATFADVPDISIDYAVMEKTRRIAVVRCEMGWSDVGSWDAFCSFTPKDAGDNRIADSEKVLLEDVENCDIIDDGERLIAALGLRNLLIVDTNDALLVADKSRTQEVKTIYNRLKAAGHSTYKHHRTQYRPWGHFTVLETGHRFKIKRLVLKPGGSISLQLHLHRSEHWIVVSGMARVTCDDRDLYVNTNESIYIKAGNRHRVANNGRIDLVIIEVQSGDYVEEDDIERFEDRYGRC